MFNADQREYMAYLASLRPDEKCRCGWYLWGECMNCTRGNGGNGYRETGHIDRKEPVGE